MKSVFIAVVAQLTPFTIPAIALAGSDIYKGVFSESFEMCAFEPCDSDERWWLDARGDINEPFWMRIKELRTEFEAKYDIELSNWATPFYYLEASGELSEQGEYGHMGGYDRQFDLTEFKVFRLATSDEQKECLTSEFHRSAK